MGSHFFAKALEVLLIEGEFQTRMRESSGGDIYDLPFQYSPWQGATRNAGEIVAALSDLQAQGAVTSTEVVNRFDSSEYITTWRLAANRMLRGAEKLPDQLVLVG